MKFRFRSKTKQDKEVHTGTSKEKDIAQAPSESKACFVLLNDTSNDDTLTQAYHTLTATKGAHCGSGSSAKHLTALGFLEGIPLMYQQSESLDATDASSDNDALISLQRLCHQDSPDMWNVVESVNGGDGTRFGILLMACTLENAALWTKVQAQIQWKDFINLKKGRLYIYLEHDSELKLDSSSHHGQKQGFLIHLHPKQTYGSATVSNGYGFILFPNGDTYEGSIHHSKMHGNGIYRGATEKYDAVDAGHLLQEIQTTYQGEWRHGRRHGIGTLTCISIVREEDETQLDTSGDVDTSGEWESEDSAGTSEESSDRRDNQGRRTVVFQYEGEWNNGSMHGKGKYIRDSHTLYDGVWKDGVREGHGVQSFITTSGTTGGQYEGSFVNNQRHGKGIQSWVNGSTYQGGFEYGKRHGWGTFKWSGGDSYEGMFENNYKHGRGAYNYLSGNTYEGEWNRDVMTGKGLYIYDDGNRTLQFIWSEHGDLERICVGGTSNVSHKDAIVEKESQENKPSESEAPVDHDFIDEEKGKHLAKTQSTSAIQYRTSISSYHNQQRDVFERAQSQTRKLSIKTLDFLGIGLKGIDLSEYEDNAGLKKEEPMVLDDDDDDQDETPNRHKSRSLPQFQMTSSVHSQSQQLVEKAHPEKGKESIENIKMRGFEFTPTSSTSPSSRSLSIPSVTTTTSPSNTTITSFPSFLDGRRFEGDPNSPDCSPREKKLIFTIIWPNGHIYKGQCQRGLRHGHGVSSHPNGNTFEGEYKSDRPHGKGILNYANKSIYKGEWTRGERTGQGIFTWSSGSVYEGEWTKGAMSGRGTYYFADGRKYRGEWQGNQKHGKGVYWWPSGNRYDGEWQHGKMHGKGVKTFRSGKVQDGIWHDNQFVG